MNEKVIDKADRRILNILQEDGRITNLDLSRQVGLSAAACFERVKRLRERRIITGYRAARSAKLGRALTIFVEVILDRATGDQFASFAERVSSIPDIMECHMVAGGFDYLLKVRVACHGGLSRFPCPQPRHHPRRA